MTLDYDGKIRMDCSSPHAMASLIPLKDRFRVAFGNDPDTDRHGIVTPHRGCSTRTTTWPSRSSICSTNRRGWPPGAAVGKTVVSSSLIDRVAAKTSGGGSTRSRSASSGSWTACWPARWASAARRARGPSFLRRDGSVWTTDKDGLIMGLLAAEMTARTGRDPGELYRALTARQGAPVVHADRRARRRPSRRRGSASWHPKR